MNRRLTHEHDGALRLFFALWPDEATRAKLAALQEGFNGRKVSTANLHLTLAFLGNQPRASLARLEQVMQALTVEPFMLRIDHYGYFSKPRIAWAGPSSPPEALMQMQRSLWTGLLEAGVPLKPVAGFRPHVTLARDAMPADREMDGVIDWSVGMMALVESVSVRGGVQYEVIAERALG